MLPNEKIKIALAKYANKNNWVFYDGAWHPTGTLYNEFPEGIEPELPEGMEYGPWLLAQVALEE